MVHRTMRPGIIKPAEIPGGIVWKTYATFFIASAI
jgi:hypothetical protein